MIRWARWTSEQSH